MSAGIRSLLGRWIGGVSGSAAVADIPAYITMDVVEATDIRMRVKSRTQITMDVVEATSIKKSARPQ